jgi:Nif11 domain
MAKKTVKKSSTSKRKTSGAKKDAAAFVDHLEKSREINSKLRKTWNEVIAVGKKKGFKFTRDELRNHFKKRYGVKSKPDYPDTCFCI